MTNEYKYNKHPKDPKLCKMIRKCITLNRKELGLEFEDVAHELGLSEGTLANKLKPSMDTHDMTLTEFVHFMELTDSYEPIEHIAKEFGFILVSEKKAQSTTANINTLVDKANIENSDVFKAVKLAMSDGLITKQEQAIVLKEIEEAQKANAELKDLVLQLSTEE